MTAEARANSPVQDLRALARVVAGLLIALAGISAVRLAVAAAPATATADALDGLHALVLIATGVTVLVWIFRANANVHSLGAQGVSAGPWMAIAWNFIPIANLAMPAAAMSDIWKASKNPADWEAERGPALLLPWWLCWVGANICWLVAERFAMEPELGMADYATLPARIADGLLIVASLSLAAIVMRISANQARARELAAFR